MQFRRRRAIRFERLYREWPTSGGGVLASDIEELIGIGDRFTKTSINNSPLN